MGVSISFVFSFHLWSSHILRCLLWSFQSIYLFEVGCFCSIVQVGKVGHEFDPPQSYMADCVWPLNIGQGAEHRDLSRHIWSSDTAMTYMPSNISCIKMLKRPSFPIDDTASKHILYPFRSLLCLCKIVSSCLVITFPMFMVRRSAWQATLLHSERERRKKNNSLFGRKTIT